MVVAPLHTQHAFRHTENWLQPSSIRVASSRWT